MEKYQENNSIIMFDVVDKLISIYEIKFSTNFDPKLLENFFLKNRGLETNLYINENNKDFQKIQDWCKNNHFKISFKKLIFKKITNAGSNSRLSFAKNLGKNKETFSKTFQACLSTTADPDFQHKKRNPEACYKTIASKTPIWNLLAIHKRAVVGIMILEEYPKYFSVNFASLLPEYRGKGFTKDLLAEAEKEFYSKDSKKYWLESTGDNNVPMCKALLSYGFKKTNQMYCYHRKVK